LGTDAAVNLVDRPDEAHGAILGQGPATITIAFNPERSSVPSVG
jgi:hypothetical protein